MARTLFFLVFGLCVFLISYFSGNILKDIVENYNNGFSIFRQNESHDIFNLKVKACSIGETALRQFSRLIAGKSDEEIDKLTGNWPETERELVYHVTFQITTSLVCGVVKETFKNGTFTDGGSYFYITQIHHYGNKTFRTVCHFSDDFNGVYHVFCPLVNQCSTISIERRFLAFHAFAKSGLQLSRFVTNDQMTVWNKEVCSSSVTESDFDNDIVSWEVKPSEGDYKCVKVYNGHTAQPYATNTTMCECLKQFKEVYIIGASHTYYLFAYLMRCPGNNYHTQPHLSFNFTAYVNSMLEAVLNAIPMLRNVTQPTPLVLQTGSWDAKYSSQRVFLIKSLNIYRKILSLLDDVVDKNRHLMVYVLPPPPNPYANNVSNAMVAAFSFQVQRLVQERKHLRYFDFFYPLYPCVNDIPAVENNNKIKNTNHYFQNSKGIGKQIWQRLIQKICVWR